MVNKRASNINFNLFTFPSIADIETRIAIFAWFKPGTRPIVRYVAVVPLYHQIKLKYYIHFFIKQKCLKMPKFQFLWKSHGRLITWCVKTQNTQNLHTMVLVPDSNCIYQYIKQITCMHPSKYNQKKKFSGQIKSAGENSNFFS